MYFRGIAADSKFQSKMKGTYFRRGTYLRGFTVSLLKQTWFPWKPWSAFIVSEIFNWESPFKNQKPCFPDESKKKANFSESVKNQIEWHHCCCHGGGSVPFKVLKHEKECETKLSRGRLHSFSLRRSIHSLAARPWTLSYNIKCADIFLGKWQLCISCRLQPLRRNRAQCFRWFLIELRRRRQPHHEGVDTREALRASLTEFSWSSSTVVTIFSSSRMP